MLIWTPSSSSSCVRSSALSPPQFRRKLSNETATQSCFAPWHWWGVPWRSLLRRFAACSHKRNPIVSERISGLARVLRANAQAAMENIALWHERDISHSSVERIIIPDSTILLNYMLHKFIDVVQGLHVYPENMERVLETTRGLVFSQRVLLALVDSGLSREEAYGIPGPDSGGRTSPGGHGRRQA